MVPPILRRDSTGYPADNPAGWIVEPRNWVVKIAADFCVLTGRLLALPATKDGKPRYLRLSKTCRCGPDGAVCIDEDHVKVGLTMKFGPE